MARRRRQRRLAALKVEIQQQRPSFRAAPWRAVRAFLLHTLYPADESHWFKVNFRSPVNVVLSLLFLCSYAGLNVRAYALHA